MDSHVVRVDPPSGRRAKLCELLRRNRERTLAAWEQAVRAAPPAMVQHEEALRAGVRGLLDGIIATLEEPSGRETEPLPEDRALARMNQGFSVAEVAWEHVLLRSAWLRVLGEEAACLEAGALAVLNEAVDASIARAVATYHHARSRRLEALDLVFREALDGSRTLDDMLHGLLRAIVDTTPSIDTAAVYLCDWDHLVLRAAVGLPPEVEGTLRLALGEGFAGIVAARRQPLFTSSAATDPMVKCEVMRKLGVRALYGVPLIHGDHLIGVAKMGSRTANELSEEDRQVFGLVADRAAALIAQRRQAEERELLVGILGHDLRAPLSTIVLSAKAIERCQNLPQDAARVLPRVTSAAQRMNRMITDLTDYTKSTSSGGLPIERRALDVHDLVTKIVAELRAVHAQREIRLDLAGDPNGEWDGGRITQVVANLVNNAVAYGAPSSPVVVAVEGDQSNVCLCVHNEGEPIAGELLPHVFDPLKRGKRGAGLGLGLYIVQQVARAHGGRAEVESTSERGTTFRVRLPRVGSDRIA